MEKKMNNKGFSLVELIVVIAIMAVLIGVLAPQFIKYVEKSRVSTDIQNVDQIVTAIQTYAAENPYPSTTDSWSLSTTASSPTSGGYIEKALKNASLSTSLALKSGNWTGAKIEVSSTGVKAVGSNSDGKTMANGTE